MIAVAREYAEGSFQRFRRRFESYPQFHVHKKGSSCADEPFLRMLSMNYFSTSASLATSSAPRRFLAIILPCGSSRKDCGMACTP